MFNFYKQKYDDGSEFLVIKSLSYFDDAETITRITEVPRFKMTAAGIPAIRISDAALEECRNRLLDAGCKVCVSEVRGVSGRHILKINETNTETGR